MEEKGRGGKGKRGGEGRLMILVFSFQFPSLHFPVFPYLYSNERNAIPPFPSISSHPSSVSVMDILLKKTNVLSSSFTFTFLSFKWDCHCNHV